MIKEALKNLDVSTLNKIYRAMPESYVYDFETASKWLNTLLSKYGWTEEEIAYHIKNGVIYLLINTAEYDGDNAPSYYPREFKSLADLLVESDIDGWRMSEVLSLRCGDTAIDNTMYGNSARIVRIK